MKTREKRGKKGIRVSTSGFAPPQIKKLSSPRRPYYESLLSKHLEFSAWAVAYDPRS